MVAQLVEMLAASRKVVGLVPDGVFEIFFYRFNPFDCDMALGSTKPLTEITTRVIFVDKGGR